MKIQFTKHTFSSSIALSALTLTALFPGALIGFALLCSCVKPTESQIQSAPSDGALELTLQAPFAELNSPSNVAASQNDKDSWRDGAELTLADGTRLQVSIKIRGNNSLNECTFRKLSLKWDKASAGKNPLGIQSNKLKIGTHCAKVEGPTKVLGNEFSPLRENFLLRVFSLIETESLKSTVARIRYIESTTKQEIGTFYALLREHEDEFAVKYNLVESTPEEALDLAHYDPSELTRQVLFQSFAANSDWRLSPLGGEVFGPRAVWNLKVYKPQSGLVGTAKLKLIPTDLDVSATVVKLQDARLPGFIRSAESIQKLGLLPSALVSLEMLFRNTAYLPISALPKAFANFREIQPGIESLTGMLDTSGQTFLRLHLSDFYKGLALFKRVVSVKSGVVGNTSEGHSCTVRSESLVLVESKTNGVAQVTVPFVDDDGIPFCSEGLSPRSVLAIRENELKSAQWD